jgi:hypothetical protein
MTKTGYFGITYDVVENGSAASLIDAAKELVSAPSEFLRNAAAGVGSVAGAVVAGTAAGAVDAVKNDRNRFAVLGVIVIVVLVAVEYKTKMLSKLLRK